jgi:hypothetical protein
MDNELFSWFWKIVGKDDDLSYGLLKDFEKIT